MKPGDKIPLTEEQLEQFSPHWEACKSLEFALEVIAERLKHRHDAMWKALRASHPELDEFMISFNGKEIKIDYPHKWKDYIEKGGEQ